MVVLFYIMIGFIIGLGAAGLLLDFFTYFKTVKVDYSIEAKTNYRPNMAGEFAIYTKKHFWSKWKQQQTYADLEWAKNDAKKLKMLPKYY